MQEFAPMNSRAAMLRGAGPSGTPFGARRRDSCALSLFVPFDVGETYFVTSQDSSTTAVWEQIATAFNQQRTEPDRFRGWWSAYWPLTDGRPRFSTLRAPYPTLLWELPLADSDMLESGLPVESDGAPVMARAFVTTMGMGVLTLQVRVPRRVAAHADRRLRDEHLERWLYGITAAVIARYRSTMRRLERGGGRRLLRGGLVKAVREVSRPSEPGTFVYGLVFEGGLPRAGYERYRGVSVDIGWVHAVVSGSPDIKTEVRLAGCFIAALAAWFSLYTMNVVTSRLFRQHFSVGPADVSGTSRRAQVISTLYLEATALSRPIHFTSKEEELDLLEAIHARWKTHRWRDVSDRVAALASYSATRAADLTARRERRLTAIAWVIGSLALVGALASLKTLLGSSEPGVIPVVSPWMERALIQGAVGLFVLAMLVFILGVLLIGIEEVWKGTRNLARRRRGRADSSERSGAWES